VPSGVFRDSIVPCNLPLHRLFRDKDFKRGGVLLGVRLSLLSRNRHNWSIFPFTKFSSLFVLPKIYISPVWSGFQSTSVPKVLARYLSSNTMPSTISVVATVNFETSLKYSTSPICNSRQCDIKQQKPWSRRLSKHHIHIIIIFGFSIW